MISHVSGYLSARREKARFQTLSVMQNGSIAFGSSVGYAPVSFLYTTPIKF